MKYTVYGQYNNGYMSKPITVNGKAAAEHTKKLLENTSNYKFLVILPGDAMEVKEV